MVAVGRIVYKQDGKLRMSCILAHNNTVYSTKTLCNRIQDINIWVFERDLLSSECIDMAGGWWENEVTFEAGIPRRHHLITVHWVITAVVKYHLYTRTHVCLINVLTTWYEGCQHQRDDHELWSTRSENDDKIHHVNDSHIEMSSCTRGQLPIEDFRHVLWKNQKNVDVFGTCSFSVVCFSMLKCIMSIIIVGIGAEITKFWKGQNHSSCYLCCFVIFPPSFYYGGPRAIRLSNNVR